METYYKRCPSCHTPYRYQDHDHGVFNYNDLLMISFPVLLEIRIALLNHTAIARIVAIMSYRLQIELNAADIENAYLAFEATVAHDYTFSCVRCGHHPSVLIHDLTKKAVFRYDASNLSPPECNTPVVDADEFWANIQKEIVARCLIRGKANPFQVHPSYHQWAPYIGPQTRKNRLLYNTEYLKVHHTEPEDHEPIPEEIITHLLADEKLDTVKRFCRIVGVSSCGSKLDILCRLRSQSLAKAKFDAAYASLYGHSGG